VIVVVELQAELKPETTWSEMRHGPDQFFFYRIGGGHSPVQRRSLGT